MKAKTKWIAALSSLWIVSMIGVFWVSPSLEAQSTKVDYGMYSVPKSWGKLRTIYSIAGQRELVFEDEDGVIRILSGDSDGIGNLVDDEKLGEFAVEITNGYLPEAHTMREISKMVRLIKPEIVHVIPRH